MNRTTAIGVALAALLAHILAINQNIDGVFSPPLDTAHVAYRIARNLVYEGTPAWNPAGGIVESYPSALWVGVCTVLTRLYLPVTFGAQIIGILSSLATVVVLAQFSVDRLAGLIALLFLVVSGTTAAAAGSGTEMPLAMLLATTAFLAFERGWSRTLGVTLTALILTRPEAWLFLGGFAAFWLLGRGRSPTSSDGWSGLRGRPAFLLPIAAGLLVPAIRLAVTGSWLSPQAALLLGTDLDRCLLGVDYCESFLLRSGAATLVVLPLFYLLRGRLSATGIRALGLVALWAALLAVQGGDAQPFWIAMTPVLPLLFLAIQEAMILLMDSGRRLLEPMTWVLFFAGILASTLVSRFPADVGPIPLGRIQRAWMTPEESLREAFGWPHGRIGLKEEIEEVERLRALGIFLRGLDADTTILTPWPGAIAYLSRKRVLDLRGRATPPPGADRPLAWYGPTRIDLAAALAQEVDYLVPTSSPVTETLRVGEVAGEWIRRLDVTPEPEGRRAELLSLLERFELVTVPVPMRSYAPDELSPTPFPLMRLRELDRSPHLALAAQGDRFVVTVAHGGHRQVVDLEVKFTDATGEVWWLRPTGEFVPSERVSARTDLLLYPAGQRPIQLTEFVLPPELATGELSAVLHNPGTLRNVGFSKASPTVRLQVGEGSEPDRPR